jgi:hypothetical protein
MSRRTIRAVDLLCDVANWSAMLANAYPDEIERWTAKRDRKLAALRKTMSGFTPDDFAYLNRKAPETLRRLRAAVIAPVR